MVVEKNDNILIGLIGVGAMGTGIGYNILKKFNSLYVLEGHSKKGVQFLRDNGATIVRDINELCSSVNAIILCLPSSVEVEKVCIGENGIIKNALQGTIVIDCTTSWPDSTKKIAGDFSKHGIKFLEAPLTRTPIEAMDGRLNCLLGGGEEVNIAIPILSSFCENIFRTGSIGDGSVMKLINNGFTLGVAAIVGEVLRIGIDIGVDLTTMREICSNSGANNPQFQGFMSWLLDSNQDALKFSLKNAIKDLKYLQTIARNSNINTNLLDAVISSYKEAAEIYGEFSTLPSIIRRSPTDKINNGKPQKII